MSESHLAYADRNEVLWTEGSPSRFFIVVGQGILKVTQLAINHQEVTIDALGPGSFGGLHLSVTGAHFTSTATSISNFWYLKIPDQVWHQVAEQEPCLNERLWNEVVNKMQHRIDLLSGLFLGGDHQRIGLIVLRIAEQFPERPSGKKATIPLSLQALAELSSTSLESTTSMVKSWQREGFVRIGAQGIRVLQPQELSIRIHQNSAAISL
ncbi:MAG: Crp/Fnr family transcriptional regulator [Armatimonadota bacterium]